MGDLGPSRTWIDRTDASSGVAPGSESHEMGGANTRWIVGAGALLVAALAFYLLLHGGPREVMHGETREAEARKLREAEASQPALDEIDARSRAAMRDLLREAGEE